MYPFRLGMGLIQKVVLSIDRKNSTFLGPYELNRGSTRGTHLVGEVPDTKPETSRQLQVLLEPFTLWSDKRGRHIEGRTVIPTT